MWVLLVIRILGVVVGAAVGVLIGTMAQSLL